MNFMKKLGQKTKELGNKTLLMLTAAIALVAATASSAFASSTSNAIDFSTTGGLGITPQDIVSSGFSFAKLFNDKTTLVLGIMLAPIAVGFIIWIIRKLPRFGK